MVEKEYESLRQEQNENRKYVFERPLLIVTAGFVLFQYTTKSHFTLIFPVIFIFLMLFNLAFTRNRLQSSARIVAYLRLMIEEQDSSDYKWETFLSKYREFEETKGLRYYPIIYWFHIIAILFILVFEVLLYLECSSDITSIISQNWILLAVLLLFHLIAIIVLITIGIVAHPIIMNNFFNAETKRVSDTIEKMKGGL